MKIPVLIVLALVLLGTGGTLAFMNNACKSSQHSWCASDLRHHAKAGRS
jgi:predicted ribosomally synthesized peptide with SipW-like signal peptide